MHEMKVRLSIAISAEDIKVDLNCLAYVQEYEFIPQIVRMWNDLFFYL